MTGSNKSLFNYTTYPSKDNVQFDGSLTSVSRTGFIVCTLNLILSSVLHVPKFSVNLLFISTITKVLNCKLEFFPDHCVFQDLQTGKTIGSGRLCDDLYLLKQLPTMSQALFGENKDVNQEIIQCFLLCFRELS
ncbi:hypothetical protein ES288_D02G076300v1 [Gossypium darwinii]|uniref:Uncharacterized protein n=1 Tax=Gossypium darwinii TaxID=34276 RepID=A0A5D2DDA0_GOSDA|nr:hypothetical protein ES288_D02G076300v1 [Gossypium darwinii]